MVSSWGTWRPSWKKVFFLKTQSGQVPQTDWFLTTFCTKRNLFFATRPPPPPMSDVLPNVFSMWNTNISLQEWLIPSVTWNIEDGHVFLQAPWAASEVEITQHKQYDWCATASYWPSIRAPESEQYFAVPGQEILGLLGCKDIYIEYFQRFFIKCQRKEEDKPKT